MSEPGHKDVHLDQLFRALLRLHKALLDDERVSYERVHGRIQPMEHFCSWCWEMRGLPGYVHYLN